MFIKGTLEILKVTGLIKSHGQRQPFRRRHAVGRFDVEHHLVIGRSTQVCQTQNALSVAVQLLSSNAWSSRPRSGRLSNVYQRFTVGWTPPNHLVGLSTVPPLILQRSKSEKFGLDFRYDSSLSGHHFETKQHVGTKVWHLVYIDDLFSPNLVQFGTPSLRSRSFKSAHWKTGEKIVRIVNNWVAHCLISLKFGTDFNHVTPDVLQTFKVKWSPVKVTAWRNVSAVKTLYVRNG